MFTEQNCFTKSSLKDFDYVVLRNGYVGIINTNFNIIFFTNTKGCLFLGDYTNNLLFNDCNSDDGDSDILSKYDIIKVYRPTLMYQCCVNNWKDGLDIFNEDRDRVKEISITELEKQYRCKIKIVD